MDKKLYEEMLNNLFDGVYYVDRHRKILFWNKGAEKISGYTAKEIVGKTCSREFLNHVDECGCSLCDKSCPLMACIKTGEYVKHVVYLHHKDGHRIPVETHVSPVRDDSGEIIGGVEVFRDVSHWKKIEELSQEKDEVLGIAAHDLRGPLATIQMYGNLLQEENIEQDTVYKAADTIVSSSKDLIGTLEELLDVEKIESGLTNIKYGETDAVRFLDLSIEEHHKLAEKKNIKVVFETQLDSCPIKVDKNKFRDVINNLVSNAVKYSKSGTTVRVVLDMSGPDTFRVRVIDQGQGIREKELKQVFRKFAKISSRPTGGEKKTGLGLSIVKKIVELHGGIVHVESEYEKGSTFTITMPCFPPQDR